MIWEGIIAYGKIKSVKTCQFVGKMPFVVSEYVKQFDKMWCPHFILYSTDDRMIRWSYQIFGIIKFKG